MTNTPPLQADDDKELREQLATAIWSVHRDNPREAILDGVMQLFEAECRRREGEARLDGLNLAWHEVASVTEGKPNRVSKCLQVIELKREKLKATLGGENQ